MKTPGQTSGPQIRKAATVIPEGSQTGVARPGGIATRCPSSPVATKSTATTVARDHLFSQKPVIRLSPSITGDSATQVDARPNFGLPAQPRTPAKAFYVTGGPIYFGFHLGGPR